MLERTLTSRDSVKELLILKGMRVSLDIQNGQHISEIMFHGETGMQHGKLALKAELIKILKV